MDRIKINLLPVEIKEAKKKENRKYTIIKISVAILILLIILTSTLLTIVIIQRSNINELNGSIDQSKTKVTSLKEQEVIVTLLKSRIDNLNQITSKDYPAPKIYNIITALVPASVRLDSMTIDKSNQVTLHGETGSTQALKVLFNNLSNPTVHEGSIKSVKIESLNRIRSNRIQFDMIILLGQI